jgi:predicted nucleotidyltransferase
MKIRIKGNALRYRLTKSDISALADNGYLQEQTDFVGQSLIYALKITDDDTLSAEFFNNTITFFIPKQMVAEMINTEKIGFEDKSSPLQLLIEKDFTCLDNVEEDQSDNYPNPLAFQKN